MFTRGFSKSAFDVGLMGSGAPAAPAAATAQPVTKVPAVDPKKFAGFKKGLHGGGLTGGMSLANLAKGLGFTSD
jgi:hypothetical protein